MLQTCANKLLKIIIKGEGLGLKIHKIRQLYSYKIKKEECRIESTDLDDIIDYNSCCY